MAGRRRPERAGGLGFESRRARFRQSPGNEPGGIREDDAPGPARRGVVRICNEREVRAVRCTRRGIPTGPQSCCNNSTEQVAGRRMRPTRRRAKLVKERRTEGPPTRREGASSGPATNGRYEPFVAPYCGPEGFERKTHPARRKDVSSEATNCRAIWSEDDGRSRRPNRQFAGAYANRKLISQDGTTASLAVEYCIPVTLKSFKCPEAIQSLRPTCTARAAADPRARRISDEAKFTGVEEAREAEMEVAQEEDAPKEAGPEAAAGLTAAQPRARPQAHAAQSTGAWGSGILTGSSYDVSPSEKVFGVRG